MCERFQIDRKALVAGFDILSCVGVPPYTPDTPIDAVVDGDMVYVHLPQWFDRPLRLTPEQGLSLVAVGAAPPGGARRRPRGPAGPRHRKIADVLGFDPDGAVDVSLGAAAAETMLALQEATEHHRQVEIDYYTYGRDERTRRVVDPFASTPPRATGTSPGCATWPAATGASGSTGSTGPPCSTRTFEPPTETPTMGVFSPAPATPG